MRKNPATRKALFILPIMLALCLTTSASLAKEQEEDTRPERGITMNFEYPEVIINKGDDVTVDLMVKNRGKRDENVYFTIASAPAGWKTKIKTYSFSISSVHVPEDEVKDVQLSAEPEKDTKPGTYAFTVNGRSEDGKLKVIITGTYKLAKLRLKPTRYDVITKIRNSNIEIRNKF